MERLEKLVGEWGTVCGMKNPDNPKEVYLYYKFILKLLLILNDFSEEEREIFHEFCEYVGQCSE